MTLANMIVRVERLLSDRLPPGWKQKIIVRGARDRQDAALNITSPDGGKANVIVRVKTRVFPRDVTLLQDDLGRFAERPGLVVTSFLSPATRRRLREERLNYLDLTGNLRLVLSRPGLFLETQGADDDPTPGQTPGRSLRGPKAGRIARALCDFAPPLAISELATKAGVDVSYASRLVDWLAREALVTRTPRGPVVTVDRGGLIRRWADDYAVLKNNDAHSFLDPRGLDNLVRSLQKSRLRYAITGSLAANRLAPVAPARLAMVYVDDPIAAAKTLGLRSTDAGANVMLLVPFDRVVFDRTRKDEALTYVAPSQAAIDLLTSPGRAPAEAEAVLDWMARNM
jgi:hypothetical protein